jgi:hypothetical protein
MLINNTKRMWNGKRIGKWKKSKKNKGDNNLNLIISNIKK